MKPNTHPGYRPVLFHGTAADVWRLIGSTAETARTHSHSDGSTYPAIASASHLIDTGKQHEPAAEGRVTGFDKRVAGLTTTH